MLGPIRLPTLVGMFTLTGSGSPGSSVESAMLYISPLSWTMDRIMSRNPAAGPTSVPPMMSTIDLETPRTYSTTAFLSSPLPVSSRYSSSGFPSILNVDQRGWAADPCSPPTKPSTSETGTPSSEASFVLHLRVSGWSPVPMTNSSPETFLKRVAMASTGLVTMTHLASGFWGGITSAM